MEPHPEGQGKKLRVSLDLEPEHLSLATGTFNLLSKTVSRVRLSGAIRLTFGGRTSAPPTVLETFKTYRDSRSAVNRNARRTRHSMNSLAEAQSVLTAHKPAREFFVS